MSEGLVMFFLQRLESVLRHETETFVGFEYRIRMIKSTLGEIGLFLVDRGSSIQGDAAFTSWGSDLRDLLHDIDDLVDEFIIQMDPQNGSDRLVLTDGFRNQLQGIELRLAETVSRMSELKNSEEGSNEQSPRGKEECQTDLTATKNEGEKEDNEGNQEKSDITEEDQASAASSSVPFRSKYTNLPYYLQTCLIYCCIFPEGYWLHKGRLVRLLVAEGLVQEEPGKILEEVADENINELVRQGMVEVKDKHRESGNELTVSPSYRMLLRDNFTRTQDNTDSTVPPAARRIFTTDITRIANSSDNLRPHSLFVLGNQGLSEGNWLNFKGTKFLRVLDLEGARIKSLPDEVADLIHLTYLGLKNNDINELPARIGDLRALQTLDIRRCGSLTEISAQILNLVRLRHLKMLKSVYVGGMQLPDGVCGLQNLLTLTGLHADGGIAGELSKLTQLRRLGVMDVAEEHACELYASIINMHGLLCLSLETKHAFNQGQLFLPDTFSPPPLLVKLRLEGLLQKLPNWFGSMSCLTKLRLGFSHLTENPTSVLQLLPNLKSLNLWHAYDAKQIGKEFCKAGGFHKLEVLIMASHLLEEWTELEEGALPTLQYLHIHNCLRLRKLPEGLQFVTTLKRLDLLPLLDEHAERLKPDSGEENYKIRHIPTISFITTSMVAARFNEQFHTPPETHPTNEPSDIEE